MIQFSLWSVLFFLIASQGLALALLARNGFSTPKPQRNFRSLYILVFSVMLFFWVGFWNNYHVQSLFFLLSFHSIPLLLGPFYYLYVKIALGNRIQGYLIHFIPFFATLIYSVGVYLYWPSLDAFLQNGKESLGLVYALHTSSFLVYGALTLFTFKKEKAATLKTLSKSKLLRIKSELALFVLFSLIAVVNFVFNRIVDSNIFLDPALGIVGAVTIYSMGYATPNAHSRRTEMTSKPHKYVRSSLSAESKHMLFERLVLHMDHEKPFLSCDFRIRELSLATKIPSHHISELLNQYYEKGFSEFVNGYRVREAQKLLMGNEPIHKISMLGYEVGFNSNATFHNWFKSITGDSPRQFQNRHKKSLE